MIQEMKTFSPSTGSAESSVPNSGLLDSTRNWKCSVNYKPFLGIFYSLCSAFFATVTFALVQKLPYMSPGQLSLFRNAAVFAGSLPVAVYSVQDILGKKEDRLILFLRGFLVGTATYMNTIAVRYLPLAEAAVVSSAMPAVVTLMARIYLKEPCGWVQSLALVFTFCGVLLTVRLPELLSSEQRDQKFDLNYFLGLSAGFASVIILSVNYVSVRRMRHVHFSVLLVYSGFIGAVENISIHFSTSYFSASVCGWDQVWVILMGVLSFFRFMATILAMQAEAAGLASVLMASMEIIFAALFQVIIFRLYPDAYTISGACFILVSLGFIGVKKKLSTLPEESKLKKRLKFCWHEN